MKKTTRIAMEFALRAKKFHPTKKPMEISLWGLFSWSSIAEYVKDGRIIPNDGYTKENVIIWCKPSQEFFDKEIEPLLSKSIEELETLSGWRV